MWIKLSKPKTETQLLKESVQQLECKVAVMEAVGDLQNELFESGLVNEGTNKILEKLKAGVMKLCPSPEKLGNFFKKIGQKVDAKMQKCKVEAIKNAWNTLKGIVGAQDSLDQQIANGEGEGEGEGEDDETQADGGDAETSDGEQDNQETGEEEDLAAESLYDDWEEFGEYDDEDGYENWSEYGDDNYEDEYDEDEYGRWYDYSYFEATGKVPVKRPVKRAASKKTSARKTPTKKTAVKKPTAKKATTRKVGTRKATTRKATTRKSRKETPQAQKQTILQWLKAHWKQVALILLIAVGIYFGIGWLLGFLMKSPRVVSAASAISKFRMPMGMNELPPGAKLVGNGVVKFANGGWLAAPDANIDVDF